MKHLLLLLMPLIFLGCSVIRPTGYIEKKECGLGDAMSLKTECFGGYSSTTISPNMFMVTFEGNEFTSIQRATDFAILRCTDIALRSGASFVSIEIAERSLVTSVSSNNGNVSTSDYPMASIYCSVSKTSAENSMNVSVLRGQLRPKYGIQ